MYVYIAKFQRMVLLSEVYLIFKLSKYSKVHILALYILNHAFGFWLAETHFCTSLEKWYGQNWTSWTGSATFEF